MSYCSTARPGLSPTPETDYTCTEEDEAPGADLGLGEKAGRVCVARCCTRSDALHFRGDLLARVGCCACVRALLNEQRPVVPRSPRNVLGWAPDTSLAHDRGALGLCKVFGLDVHGEAFVALRLAQHTREQLTINRTTVLLNTGHAQGGCVREEESRELSHGPLSHVPLATWLAMSSSCHAVTMAGLGSGAA